VTDFQTLQNGFLIFASLALYVFGRWKQSTMVIMMAAEESSSATCTSPPRKMMQVLSVVLAICLVLPMFFYNREMHHYLGNAATISYNTGQHSPATNHGIGRDGSLHEWSSSSIPVLGMNETVTVDDRYRRFLTLTDPSTIEMRQWLNQSLAESTGWVVHRHDDATMSSPPNRRSTVTYRACCGLGHRLARLEDAAHVALLFEATLAVVWHDCGPDTFQLLFGPEPFQLGQSPATLDGHDTSAEARYHWTFANDVPNCYSINGVHQRPDLCADILQGRDQTSRKLYQELLDRYLRRDIIQNFTETHFAGKTSIGIHIRAGNNETGDFTRKNRQINDMNGFVKTNAERVRGMVPPNTGPAVLFVATDTPAYVEAFRNELNGIMPVVELQQIRAKEGTGVLFGEHGAPKPQGEICLEGWHAALQDIMILSSTNVVLAATYSSFTRTMPRVMALSRPNRPIPESFCENSKLHDQRMVCYQSFDSFNANPPFRIRR
jgi:Nodulation protein Z (NodZ)